MTLEGTGDPLIGKTIDDRYWVLKALGRGGMGAVYEAEQVRLGKRVAIKFLTGDVDPDALARFRREARVAARITHPHVVHIFDVGGEEDGSPYIAMELVAGRDLRSVLADGPLAVDRALAIARQILDGLAAIHGAGIVHRDIKPANILLTSRADGEHVTIMDFGISKAIRDHVEITRSGVMIGTPQYMAPEQLTGQDAGPRTDLYAVGLTLYAMLSGEPPFSGSSTMELAASQLRDRARSLDEVRPGLPLAVVRAVARALEKDAGKRFATAGEFAAALDASIAEVITQPATDAEAPTRPSEPAVTSTRRRWLIATGLAVVVVGGLVAWRATRSSPVARGGTARIAIGYPTEPFDVFSIEQSRTRIAMGLVVDPLLQTGADGESEPWTIERSELRDGAKQLVLHLRSDLMFHPHPCLPGGAGRLATAKDVAFSLRQAIDHGSITLPSPTVTETGPLEVTLAFAAPSPFSRLQLSSVWLLPAELAGCDDLRKLRQPVGTGAFRFAAPPDGVRLTLVAADHYWRRDGAGDRLPKLAAVEIQAIDDLRAALGRVATGDLDIVLPAFEDWSSVIDLDAPRPQLAAGYRGLDVEPVTHTSRNLVEVFGLFVTKKPGPLDDVRIRRAIALGLDRAKLVVADPSIGRPSGRLLDQRMLGFDPMLEPFGYQPAAASALVAEVSRGAELPELAIGTLRDPRLGTVLVEQLAAIGIRSKLVSIPAGKGGDALANTAVDALVVTSTWPLYDGENVDLMENLQGGRTDPQVEEVHRALSGTVERAGREAIHRKSETMLLERLPYIPIAASDRGRVLDAFVVGKRVHGFHDRATGFGSFGNLIQMTLAP